MKKFATLSWQLFWVLLILFFMEKGKAFPQSSYSHGPNGMKMPSMAQKAGGRWKPELLNQSDNDDVKPTSATVEADEDYDYATLYEYSASEEDECPYDMFYHVRGKQCVPLRCPPFTKRDQSSGTCEEEYIPPKYYRPYAFPSAVWENWALKRL